MKNMLKKLTGLLATAMLTTALCAPAFAFDEWTPEARNTAGLTMIADASVTYQDGVFTIANTSANPRGIQGIWIDGRDLTKAQGDAWSFGSSESTLTIRLKPHLLESLEGETHTLQIDFLNHRLEKTFETAVYQVDEPGVNEPQDRIDNLSNPNTGGDTLDPYSPVFGVYMQARDMVFSAEKLVQSLFAAVGILIAGMFVWAVLPRKKDTRA